MRRRRASTSRDWGVCGGLSPWADGRPRGSPKDWSRQPGSVRTHQTESEGVPGGVRRGAPRRAAILQRRALSDIEDVTVRGERLTAEMKLRPASFPVRRQRHGTQSLRAGRRRAQKWLQAVEQQASCGSRRSRVARKRP